MAATKVINTVGNNPSRATKLEVQPPLEPKTAKTQQLVSIIDNEASLVFIKTSQKNIEQLQATTAIKDQGAQSLKIAIEQNTFQFNPSDRMVKLLQSGAQLMLNSETVEELLKLPLPLSTQTVTTALKPPTEDSKINKQLVLVAKAIEIKIPLELIKLAKTNDISPQKLLELASRDQGYPLPTVDIKASAMQFKNGTKVLVSPLIKLPEGVHLAHINQHSGQLLLKLTPILYIANVDFSAIKTEKPADINSQNIIITKNEPAQILGQFLKKLENIPFATSSRQAENPKPLLEATPESKQVQTVALQKVIPSTSNLDPAITKTPFEVLNQNFHKAGAMPIKESVDSKINNNLATELLKSLPKLDPMPLTQLVNIGLLKSELLSLTKLNITNTLTLPNISSTAGAITTLFQLLLGYQLKNAQSSLSPKLLSYMAKLQQKVFSSSQQAQNLFSALTKVDGVESMGKLVSSIALYQQASCEPNQNQAWYFAVPYSISQRNEQLEGKFEQESNDDQQDNKSNWRLQLKFNLAQGPLLINAYKQGDYLDLKFTGDNQQVLSKVNQYQNVLASKIQQAGFQPREITSVEAKVPATLLPGDHYLVKTNA